MYILTSQVMLKETEISVFLRKVCSFKTSWEDTALTWTACTLLLAKVYKRVSVFSSGRAGSVGEERNNPLPDDMGLLVLSPDKNPL